MTVGSSGPSTAAALRALMRTHQLSRLDVARILGEVSGEEVALATVHAWLRPASNRAHRNMPASKLRMLEWRLTGRV